MSLKKLSAAHRFLPGRTTLLLAGTLILCACASQQLEDFKPPRLRHTGPEIQVADIDVLAVSPAMDEFLERYILQYPNSETRIHLLYLTVLKTGVLGFDYDESRTLTAAEAFATRSGNCIGFANMMIALARRVGLEARYQEVVKLPEWSMNEDTVLLVKHVNVVVGSRHRNYVLDVSGIKFSQNAQRRIIGDNYAKALYLNNLGAEALIENDLPRAWAYMTKAITVEPMATDSWVNLGVVLGRNDQSDDAITAYQRALQIDPYQLSAMNNLYEVYIERGDLEAAENLQTRVEKYRRDNPYYLLQLSGEALELGQFEEAISLLEKAIRMKADDHFLYFALAKTQYQSGEKTAAENSLTRARELAPLDVQVSYARPLDVLIAEERAEREIIQP